jgi:cytosine/adenosine deaminase-related metal-dependent hydrolase
VDGSGCVVTPGLVNTHHHLYQWVTRGEAVDGTLFEWLTALYPVWGGIDAGIVRTAATGALSWLARTGCTTTTDHHYVFPREGGDVFAAEVQRPVTSACASTRAAVDGPRPQQRRPAAGPRGRGPRHDPRRHRGGDRRPSRRQSRAMVRVAVAPCSPFSVTGELLREAAELARRRDVRMHTHLAETLDEEDFCRERFNSTPVQYVESLGWLGPTCGSRTRAPGRRVDRPAGRDRNRCRALPVEQRASRRGHRSYA